MTPGERTLRARLGAHVLHSQGGTNTGPAREAFLSKFYQEVDPNLELDPEERERRAYHARRAYFTRLALRSAMSRRAG